MRIHIKGLVQVLGFFLEKTHFFLSVFNVCLVNVVTFLGVDKSERRGEDDI